MPFLRLERETEHLIHGNMGFLLYTEITSTNLRRALFDRFNIDKTRESMVLIICSSMMSNNHNAYNSNYI